MHYTLDAKKTMKILFLFLTFWCVVFQMRAASYEDVLNQVETWIQKKYPKDSLARDSYETKLKSRSWYKLFYLDSLYS